MFIENTAAMKNISKVQVAHDNFPKLYTYHIETMINYQSTRLSK